MSLGFPVDLITPAWVLKAHAAGALLLGLGLLHGAWAWHRARALEALMGQPAQARGEGPAIGERRALLKRLRTVYLLTVVPGSLTLLASGFWLIHQGSGWAAVWMQPWLVAMLGVTLLEFSEGITLTRQHLDTAIEGRLSRGDFSPHLDLPLYLAVLACGLWRPMSWLAVGSLLLAAGAVAGLSFALAQRSSPSTSGFKEGQP
jgi:hypothetical protein